MYFNIYNKIENGLATTCGNPWLPPDLNYVTKSLPYNNTIYKVVVELWHFQNIKYIWENCNGIKEGKGFNLFKFHDLICICDESIDMSKWNRNK
jgi:hypothetical protein